MLLFRSEDAGGRREPRGRALLLLVPAVLSEAEAFGVEEAWMRKEEIEGGERAHRACPRCAEEGAW